MDKRQLPKMKPPQERGKRPVTVYLDPADYRLLYDLCMDQNRSAPEVVRRLIRGTALK
jgi:hypothetical protein